jgi:hypothetical protein
MIIVKVDKRLKLRNTTRTHKVLGALIKNVKNYFDGTFYTYLESPGCMICKSVFISYIVSYTRVFLKLDKMKISFSKNLLNPLNVDHKSKQRI